MIGDHPRVTPLDARAPLAGTRETWEILYAQAHEERERRAARAPDPFLAGDMLSLGLRLASCAAALGRDEAIVEGLTASAAWGAAAATCERFAAGTLVISFAEAGYWRLPCRAGTLTPPQFIDALAAAILVRDRRALAVLSDRELLLTVHRGCLGRGAPIGGERFWPLFGGLFVDTVQGTASGLASFAACRAALEAEQNGAIFPSSSQALKVPLLDLMQALQGSDAGSWPILSAAAAAKFEAFFSQPDWARLDIGMIALQLAALCTLAHDRLGAPAEYEAPVLPAVLIRGATARSWTLTYEFPRRRAANPRQIHWLLDLDGVPEGEREHRLSECDDMLVAQYTVRGWAGLDVATADFILDPDAPPLDAGELMLAADLHARQVPADPAPGTEDLYRGHLLQSIAALDALLALIPGGAAAVPAEAFLTVRGQAVRAAEPGRFDLDRLRAVRGAYQRLLLEIERSAARQSAAAETATAAPALISLTVVATLKEQLEPLVRALSADRTGEILRAVRPRPEDYAKAFKEPLASVAAQEFARVWSEPLSLYPARPEQSQLLLDLAPAGILAGDNELSARFPGGYRRLAPHLVPHRVWARWKLVRPGARVGTAYDGLVWLDGHWAWFPKPYRVLANYLDTTGE